MYVCTRILCMYVGSVYAYIYVCMYAFMLCMYVCMPAL
jgi:hypothetical protein